MPNTENIDKLIEWIKADQGQHLQMAGWQTYLDRPAAKVNQYEHCNTAFCLAGWIDQHLQREAGATNETLNFTTEWHQYKYIGADWLGISPDHAATLFLMNGEYQRMRFDRLQHEERTKIAIDVLEVLKNTGRVAWNDFVSDSDDDEDEDDDGY